MPPRITRNSDRPRASKRTMVDTQIPGPLLRLDWRRSPRKDESHGNGKQAPTNLLERIEGHTHMQWAGSRDENLLGVRSREKLFLDIPFYRTHLMTTRRFRKTPARRPKVRSFPCGCLRKCIARHRLRLQFPSCRRSGGTLSFSYENLFDNKPIT
jgi:hypothetical protein